MLRPKAGSSPTVSRAAPPSSASSDVKGVYTQLCLGPGQPCLPQSQVWILDIPALYAWQRPGTHTHTHTKMACPSIRHVQKPSTCHTIPQTQANTYTSAVRCGDPKSIHVQQHTCSPPPTGIHTCEYKRVHSHTPAHTLLPVLTLKTHKGTHAYIYTLHAPLRHSGHVHTHTHPHTDTHMTA